MATIESLIVSRSTLPADGTYTMLEHILHMALETNGEYVNFILDDSADEVLSIEETLNIIVITEEQNELQIIEE